MEKSITGDQWPVKAEADLSNVRDSLQALLNNMASIDDIKCPVLAMEAADLSNRGSLSHFQTVS